MSTSEMVSSTQTPAWQRYLLAALPHSATYLLLGLGILLLDLVTGRFLLPFILFVIPVALAAWFSSGRTAYVTSLLFPMGSLAIVLFLEHSAPPPYAALNALLQIGVLVFIAFASRTARQNVELKRRLKLLEVILPVCMGCKRIRDEHRDWQSLEVYVTRHTESVVSHGICPECVKRLYPDFTDPALDG